MDALFFVSPAMGENTVSRNTSISFTSMNMAGSVSPCQHGGFVDNFSGISDDQVFEFIGITRLDGKMGLQKISDILNGVADSIGTLTFADSRGDTAHQAVPFFLGDFLVDSFIGQQPHFLLKN